jgi:hypothetical protein
MLAREIYDVLLFAYGMVKQLTTTVTKDLPVTEKLIPEKSKYYNTPG